MNDCIDIVSDRLENSKERYIIKKPPKYLVRRILELILKRNCFEFDGEFYAQIWGASQGNIASPEISDLVMYVLEKEFILTDPNILFYRRYRDDILMCYQGSTEDLQGLKDRMNTAHSTLKFTFEISNDIVTFLDLRIHKGPRFAQTGCLDHRINLKKTDTHQWLCPESAHSPSVFKAMIKGETIRYCRGTTSEIDFVTKVGFFTDKLVERNYSRTEVNKITEPISHANRVDYINKTNEQSKGKYTSIPLVFVTTYTPHIITQDLKNILLNHWDKINSNPDLKKLFPNAPLLAFKRAKNISDILVRSKLPSIEPAASIKGKPTKDAPNKSPAANKGGSVEETAIINSSVQWNAHDLELINILTELSNE